MENKKLISRDNDFIEITPFKFAGIINGYYLKINGKEELTKTFKTEKDALKELKLRGFRF